MRHRGRLHVDERLQHLELRRMLAKKRAEAGLAQLVSVPAMAADEQRDLARMWRGARNQPSCGTADFHVVEPDIALANALREVRQQRKYRLALLVQPAHG